MSQLYPLRFEPIFRHYLWGGRRLAALLDKALPADSPTAESWEVADHGDSRSCVAQGPLRGTSLRQLCDDFGTQLLGACRHAGDRFPLLIKFLDAQQNLSVQVHPDDRKAAAMHPPDRGKTEAWVVLHADPGATIYAGLKRGFDRAALAREIARGTTALCLHQFEPQVGDCVLLPAGTVHALGAGLVVAEIQQASDTTFRLYDWNRVGADGQPRELHIQQALDALDDTLGPIQPQKPQPTDREHVERLVQCDYFQLDRWRFDRATELSLDGYCHVIIVLEGSIRFDSWQEEARRGQSWLLPAALDRVKLQPAAATTLLNVRVL